MTTDSYAFRAYTILQQMDSLFAELIDRQAGKPDPTPVVHNNVKKLTKRDALVIRQMRRAGSTQQEIADSFDVNRATISRICRGHYWK